MIFKNFSYEYLLVIAVMFLIPGIYMIEVYLVLPSLYEIWSFWYNIHFTASLFLLHNIVGNFFLGLTGPGYVIKKIITGTGWKECTYCNIMAPPRSWHCHTCKRCILKRDHHCHFFGCCVGYNNFRYFYMFVGHVLFSCLYAFVVNIIYFIRFGGYRNFNIVSLMNFFLPFASLINNLSGNNLFVSLLGFNVILIGFTGVLFIYHGRGMLTGRTPGELKHSQYECYDCGLKWNLTEAFGYRWYMTWISPFLKSQLPGDGTTWVVNPPFKND